MTCGYCEKPITPRFNASKSYRRRFCDMAHLKAARYARERGAKGSHTLEQWEALKERHDHKCVGCDEVKPLTRDHIIPLALGGSHDITNIQPLCRNCNSRKWMKLNIYENPELLSNPPHHD